jgi:RNA polymerase sigma factor (sigma-70 family)
MSNEYTTDFVTEITFTLRDESYPIVYISSELECRLDLLEIVQSVEERHLIEFCRIADGRPDHIVDVGNACDRTVGVEILGAGTGESLVELAVSGCVAETVAKANVIFRSGHAESGKCQFTVYLPPTRDSTAVVDTIQADHPSVTVASLRDRPLDTAFLTQQSFQRRLEECLTDRQWEVLELAYRRGYFERPREIPQHELAEQLGISQETVSQHLRAAHRRLLPVVFEEGLQR